MKKLFILISMLFFLASCGDDPTSSKKKCDPACGEWQTCDTKKGECILTEGRCEANTDCTDTTKPVCNVTTHNCEAEVQPECTVNADCTDTAKPICENGVCVADVQPECTVNADCTDTAKPICENGVCVADVQPECTIDADCEANEICVEGVCEVVQPECTIDADCEANEICVEGVCEVVQPECTIDADCEANEICVEGVCEVVQPECITDADCEANEICVEGICEVVQPDCTTDADCEANEICVEGVCVVDIECTTDADCLDPANPACVRGFCMENQDACADFDCSGFPNTECVVFEEEAQCFCIENYYVNEDQTACVSGEELCTELNCSQYGNAECVIDAEGPGCFCLEGNYYDGTSCIPIPACTDDAIPNEIANALLITLPYEQTHHSCTTKIDYFKVELTAGIEFTANLSFVSGDLDLVLLNAPEMIESNVVDVSAEDGLIPESISITVETSGTYYLAVVPYRTVDTEYTLSVSAVVPECVVDTDCTDMAKPLCEAGVCVAIECEVDSECEAGEVCTEGRCELDTTCVDDAIGNTKETATLVTLPFAGNHKVCADVSDFFKVALNAGEIVTINLSNYGELDLDLYLYNETSTVSLKSSTSITSTTEQVVYTITVAGNYYVKVRNWDETLGTNYDLSIATVVPECAVDADCTDVTKPLCEANVCVAAECSNEVPCGLGEVCVLGRCETAPECEVDADCADGEICDMGQCVVDTTCVDDAIGNSFATATVLTAPYTATNHICAEVTDFYSINLTAGQVISITLNGYGSNDLDLYLTNAASTQAIVARSEENDPTETINYTVSANGTYYIAISPYDVVSSDYMLSVTVTDPECTVDADCEAGEICTAGTCEIPLTCAGDLIGNSFETATTITLPYTSTNVLCEDVEDYFKVNLTAGQTITITVNNYNDNDFDLYLTNAASWSDANVVGYSYENDPEETITYTVSTTGVYYINVDPYLGEGNYSISVTVE